MAWFNHNGVWFRVHGDPGTDEARELMRMAVSDLSLSKAQNVNNLEIIDVNRFPFYHVKSHFGKDVVELWPKRFAEVKKEEFQRIERIPRGGRKVYYAFAYEVCDRDFIDGSTDTWDEGDIDPDGIRIAGIPVPVGYAICQPGSLGGWKLLETENVIPMHFMAWVCHETNSPGDWGTSVSSYRSSHPESTVYPFCFPDWKTQAEQAGGNCSGYRPYQSEDIINGIIQEKLVAISETNIDGAIVTKSIYDVPQPLEMQESMFFRHFLPLPTDPEWHHIYPLMTSPGQCVPYSGEWPGEYSPSDYLSVNDCPGWGWDGGGQGSRCFSPYRKFGPPYIGNTRFSAAMGSCCAENLDRYVQLFHHVTYIPAHGGSACKDWLHIGDQEANVYFDSGGEVTDDTLNIYAWEYRWFDIAENNAYVPVIIVRKDDGILKVACELYQYSNGSVELLDEIEFNNVGMTTSDWTWDKTWFELTDDNGETLKLSNGNTARCWGAFRLFKIIEETEHKDKIEITEGER